METPFQTNSPHLRDTIYLFGSVNTFTFLQCCFNSLNPVSLFSTNHKLKCMSREHKHLTVVDQPISCCFDQKKSTCQRDSKVATCSERNHTHTQQFCCQFPLLNFTPQQIYDSQQYSLYMCNSMENVAHQGLQCHM